MINGTNILVPQGTYTTNQVVAASLAPGTSVIQLWLNVVDIKGGAGSGAPSGSVTVLVEGKIPGTSSYFTHLQGAAITSNGITRFLIGTGVTAANNLAAADFLTGSFRVTVTANNANPVIYSLTAY